MDENWIESVCFSLPLSLCLCPCLCLSISVPVSVCLSLSLSLSFCLSLSVCLCLCLSLSPSLYVLVCAEANDYGQSLINQVNIIRQVLLNSSIIYDIQKSELPIYSCSFHEDVLATSIQRFWMNNPVSILEIHSESLAIF